MTPEQRKRAEEWAELMLSHLDAPNAAPLADLEIAALLRAGIAAGEECERLEMELAAANEALRTLPVADPFEVRTDNRETLKNALAEIERLREGCSKWESAAREADNMIADKRLHALFGWLAAWDAEWRAQQAGSYAAYWEDLYWEDASGQERGDYCALRALLKRAERLLRDSFDGLDEYWEQVEPEGREFVQARAVLLAEIEEVGK